MNNENNGKKNRVFAVLNWKKDRVENVEREILGKIHLRDGDRAVVFSSRESACLVKDAECVVVSDEDGHNRAAFLNFAYKHLKENFPGFYGYTFYDSIQIKRDPSEFFDKIEEMVSKLHLDVWFNTYTDGCNFVFNKFDGRVSIAINDPEFKKKYDKTIIWASHSNPNVTLIDLDAFELGKDGKTFDDRFDIPMFWIIKFLCERARDKKGFMNHYPTIADEIGVCKTASFNGLHPTPEQMQKEDKMFTELKLDHTPNQNIEALMDFIVDRLKQ